MLKEILSKSGFSESDITILEKREDYEEIRAKVEKMQAERLLDQLEARTQDTIEQEAKTLEDRWKFFKESILSLPETPHTPSPVAETVEETRTRLKEEAIQKAEQTIRAKSEKIPLIGPFLADWLIEEGKELRDDVEASKGFGGMIKKFLLSLVASFLGVKGILGKLDDDIATTKEPPIPKTPPTPKQDPGNGLDTGAENLNLKNFRYNTGLNTLIFFSDGQNLENSSNVRNKIYEKIKDLPLNEVSALRGDPERQVEIFGENLNIAGFKEGLNILLPSFANPQFLEVCELSLGGNRIENILAPNEVENKGLFTLLGEQRSREIIKLSNTPGFKLASLTMYELSILYSASFPNLAYMTLANSMQLGVDVLDTTSQELQDMVTSSASSKILAYVTGNDGNMKSLLHPTSDKRFLSEIREHYPEISVEEIQAVIDFKNYIISPDFQSYPRLKLSGEEIPHERLEAFKANLNYTRIIMLYDILKGGKVEEINPLNFPLLILAISSIIGGNTGDNIKNAGLSEQYKGEFMRNSAVEFFGRNDLSESEKRAFDIYGEGLALAGISAYFHQVYQTTKMVESVVGLSNISDETKFFGSSMLVYGGKRVLQSAYPAGGGILVGRATTGRYLMRAGWAGMLIYGGLLGYEYAYGDESKTEGEIPHLPTRDHTNYIGHQVDKDIESADTAGKQMQILSQLRESTHEYMIGDEPITVITYPGDIPHAVYQGKIWTFQVLDEDNLAGSIEGHLVDFIKKLEGGEEEVNNNSVWSDGSGIYVGPNSQNAYHFSLDELFQTNRSAMGINTVRDVFGSLKTTMDDLYPGHGYTGGKDIRQYISLTSLPEGNTFLGLIAVPTLPQTPPVS